MSIFAEEEERQMIKLIHGTETYLLDKTLEADIAGIELPEMNVTRFEDEYDIKAVERICFTEPFLSGERAVVLRLTELKANEELKKLIGKIPENVTFIIAADKVDKRSTLYKAFKKSVFECSKPETNKVYDLICRVVEKEGCRAERDAVEEMVRRLNYYDDPAINLYLVIGCARQLSQSGNVTLSLVRAMLPESSAGKAWNLLRLICERRMTEAFSLLNYLLDSGESAIGILSLILRGFRLAWKDAAGVPVENSLRYQYAPAAVFSAQKLVLAQEALENAVERLKLGAEAGAMTRLALVKVSDVLQKN